MPHAELGDSAHAVDAGPGIGAARRFGNPADYACVLRGAAGAAPRRTEHAGRTALLAGTADPLSGATRIPWSARFSRRAADALSRRTTARAGSTRHPSAAHTFSPLQVHSISPPQPSLTTRLQRSSQASSRDFGWHRVSLPRSTTAARLSSPPLASAIVVPRSSARVGRRRRLPSPPASNAPSTRRREPLLAIVRASSSNRGPSISSPLATTCQR